VKNVKGTIKWENKGEILQRREDKKKKGKGEAPGSRNDNTDCSYLSTTESISDFIKKRENLNKKLR